MIPTLSLSWQPLRRLFSIGCIRLGLIIAGGLVFGWHPSAFAGACLGDSLKYRSMSYEIGVQKATTPNEWLLPCDTMVVEVGKIAEVFPGTLVTFGPRSNSACIIQVRGQLIANGTQSLPIYFAGNAIPTSVGVVYGKRPWGGLVIDSLGSVNFRQVHIVHAATAAIFADTNGVLDSVHYFASYGLILSGGRNFKLNPKGSFYPKFNLHNPLAVITENNTLIAGGKAGKQSQSKSHMARWVWGGSLVALAMVGGGAAAYVYWPIETEPINANPQNAAKTAIVPLADPPELTSKPRP
jgi:hypothetical protein